MLCSIGLGDGCQKQQSAGFEGGEGAWQEYVPWHVPAAWEKVAAGEQWEGVEGRGGKQHDGAALGYSHSGVMKREQSW